ncbi:MAG: hypothetical protein NW215_08875 [Hyphomicrobiales bacterium]|nr:hypothetical protein [Hyphomicrobiales bacterium]
MAEYQYKVKDNEKEERDRYGFFWWWTNFLRTIGSIIGLGAVTAGVILMLQPGYFDPWIVAPKPVEVAAPAPEPAPEPAPAPPPQPEKVAVVTERKGDTVVFPIEGVDAAGRKAAFDVLILTKDYNWVKGSTTEVVKGAETLTDADLIARIFIREVRDVLTKASDVIAVGAASQEGQSEAEIARAEARARASAGWLKEVVAPETPVWMLNLGQYQGCPGAVEQTDTSFQRPLMLIGVHSKDADANLSEALANAIAGKSNLPSRDCYSRFDFIRDR